MKHSVQGPNLTTKGEPRWSYYFRVDPFWAKALPVRSQVGRIVAEQKGESKKKGKSVRMRVCVQSLSCFAVELLNN